MDTFYVFAFVHINDEGGAGLATEGFEWVRLFPLSTHGIEQLVREIKACVDDGGEISYEVTSGIRKINGMTTQILKTPLETQVAIWTILQELQV